MAVLEAIVLFKRQVGRVVNHGKDNIKLTLWTRRVTPG